MGVPDNDMREEKRKIARKEMKRSEKEGMRDEVKRMK